MPAIVLAGGATSAEFAAEAGLEPLPGSRGLAEIDGLPMVGYVLRALRQAESVGEILVVAPPGFPTQPGVDAQLVGGASLVDNIEAGLARCGGASHALLSTADIPFITPAAVDDYVRACLARKADLCYCAVPKAACDRRFPGMKRTYLPTPSGKFTGGNMVVTRVAAFSRAAALVREAYPRRKNPAYLVQLIGPANLLKLLLQRICLKDIEASASRRMGIECRLVVTDHAELGTDVDRPEDLRLARQLLSAR